MIKRLLSALLLIIFTIPVAISEPIDKPVATVKLIENDVISLSMFKDLVKKIEKQYQRILTLEEKKLLLNKLIDENIKGAALVRVFVGEAKEMSKFAKANVNAIDKKNGVTAMWMASQNGHTEIVRLLLEYGADVNIKAKNGKTSLRIAKQKGNTQIIELLEKAGAKE